MHETKEKLLTRDELARMWSCSTRHLDNLVKAKKLAVVKIGQLVRFSAAEIERFILAGGAASSAKGGE